MLNAHRKMEMAKEKEMREEMRRAVFFSTRVVETTLVAEGEAAADSAGPNRGEIDKMAAPAKATAQQHHQGY